MAVFWRLIPVILSCILLAAHFSRAGMSTLALMALALPLLLLVRQPWSARLLQMALLVAGFEWLRTIRSIASRRMEAGEPWLRMALILGVVTLFTWGSALVFRSPVMRRIWSGNEPDARD
jgi:hypothetical protein